MNQEIIRMTSGDIKALDEYNDLVNATKFNFLKQRWYAQDGKLGGLWSYPDGTIHDEGVVNNDGTVTSILLEMCLLAKNCPGLFMDVAIWTPNTKYIKSGRRSRQIVISLSSGKVRVRYEGGNYRANELDAIPCCKVDYQGMQKKRMKLLDNDYLQQIIHKNDLDKEAYKKEADSLSVLHEIGAYPLCRMLICYLNRKFNWHLGVEEFMSYTARISLLFMLFTFDKEKVEKYLRENSRN